jgi:hypothetical protein
MLTLPPSEPTVYSCSIICVATKFSTAVLSTRRYVYSSTMHTAHGTYIYLVLVTHVHTGTTTKFSTNYRIH